MGRSEALLNSRLHPNPIERRLGREFLRNVPHLPGVYFFLDAEEVPLYIGKALDLRKRLASYWALGAESERAHLLDMLEAARAVTWEVCATEDAASRREYTLIRDLLPTYNIAGAWETADFLIGVASDRAARGNLRFELVFNTDPGKRAGSAKQHLFGCIRNDRKSKRGYPALLRLLHLLGTQGRWYHYPAAISRAYLPYEFRVTIPPELLPPLLSFLGGRSFGILREISLRLLDNEAVPRFLSGTIQEDLLLARDFFRNNIRTSRLAVRQLSPSQHGSLLTSAQLRAFVRKKTIEKLQRRSLDPPGDLMEGDALQYDEREPS